MKTAIDASLATNTALIDGYKGLETITPYYYAVEIFFAKWNDVDDHSLGFTVQGTVDVTGDIEKNKLAPIIDEIEQYERANVGVIRGSQYVQEFLERTEPGSDYGKLKNIILSRNNSNSAWWYTYPYGVTGATPASGLSPANYKIHLWGIRVYIGNEDMSIFVSRGLDSANNRLSTWEFIYGWLWDDDYQDEPYFIESRSDPQSFSLTAKSLYDWLCLMDVGTTVGDLSNPSGLYYHDGAVQNNETLWVCNEPTIRTAIDILHEGGCTDDELTEIEIPPNEESTTPDLDYSTLDAWTLDDATEYPDPTLTTALPDMFFWKNVGYEDYYVSIRSPYTAIVYVTIIDRLTGWIYRESLTITDDTDVGIRRLWYSGTGDIFWVGADLATHHWKVFDCTLSGTRTTGLSLVTTYDAAQDLSPSGSYLSHWGQCDLYMEDAKLYAAQCYNTTGSGWPVSASYYRLGYWDLSNGAWTTLPNSGLTQRTFIVPKYSSGSHPPTKGNRISGFKIALDASRNVGICAFALTVGDGGLPHLSVFCYDEADGTGVTELDYEDTSGQIVSSEWFAWMFTDSSTVACAGDTGTTAYIQGRGSIGGFHDSTNDEFEFQLTSFQTTTCSRMGYWCHWTPGTPSGAAIVQVDSGLAYRSFASQGANTSTCRYSIGFAYDSRNRATTEAGETDFQVALRPIQAHKDSTTRDTYDVGADYETYAFWISDEHCFPVVSAPSLTAYSASPSRYYARGTYHPFNILKCKEYGQLPITTLWSNGRNYLTVLSHEWFSNFSYNYENVNASLGDILSDMAMGCGLSMRLNHNNVYIRPRWQSNSAEDTLINSVIFNSQSEEGLPKYDNLHLQDCTGADHYEYETTDDEGNTISAVKSRNILEWGGGTGGAPFILPHRADVLIDYLWNIYSQTRQRYNLECVALPYLEPMDNITLPLLIAAGGSKLEGGVFEIFSIEHRDGLSILEIVNISGITPGST